MTARQANSLLVAGVMIAGGLSLLFGKERNRNRGGGLSDQEKGEERPRWKLLLGAGVIAVAILQFLVAWASGM